VHFSLHTFFFGTFQENSDMLGGVGVEMNMLKENLKNRMFPGR
jgi:hypothetical protein